MAINRYDRAAEAPIINTYVPIDFDQLYRIGVTQKQAIDEAADQLSTAVQRFGEFRSPSRVDTERYYAETLGKMAPWIEQAAADPNSMKDAGWRAGLQAALNGLNYANISQLQESADNLRAGLEMRAKMEAEGRLNRNWDRSDIANYDTLSSGVFSDITPIRYMSANELSDPYFNNLKPSDLGFVTRNGVRYNRTGISYDTLYNIADARFNDLVRTPQGQMYYRDLLQANGNDPESARAAFVSMIADSQRDRIIDSYDVDPVWFTQWKNRNSSGNTDTNQRVLTRLDLVHTSLTNRRNDIFNSQYNKLNEEQKKQFNDSYNNRVDTAAKKMEDAYIRYVNTQAPMDAALFEEAKNQYQATLYSPIREANRQQMLDTFRNKVNFSAEEGNEAEGYTRENYRRGVQAALDEASVKVSNDKDDAWFSQYGGTPRVVTDEAGNQTNTYGYANSTDFLLPETVFVQSTGVTPRDTRRESGWFGSRSLVFQQLFEGGELESVNFTPQNRAIETGYGQVAVKGIVRIPVDEIERKVGTRIPIIGAETTESALNELYGATKVTRIVGEDGVEYFQFPAYRVLPPEDGTAVEANTTMDQLYYGNVGSASLRANQYPNTPLRTLNGM